MIVQLSGQTLANPIIIHNKKRAMQWQGNAHRSLGPASPFLQVAPLAPTFSDVRAYDDSLCRSTAYRIPMCYANNMHTVAPFPRFSYSQSSPSFRGLPSLLYSPQRPAVEMITLRSCTAIVLALLLTSLSASTLPLISNPSNLTLPSPTPPSRQAASLPLDSHPDHHHHHHHPQSTDPRPPPFSASPSPRPPSATQSPPTPNAK